MQTCWMHTYSFYALPPHPFLWLCRSYFGREYEVICHTYLDSHRVEEDKNYWVIVTGNPGDEGGTMLDRPEPQPGGTGKNEFHEETKNVKIPDYNWQRLLTFWFLFFWFSDFSIWNVYFKKRYENLPLIILYNLVNSSYVDGKKMTNTHWCTTSKSSWIKKSSFSYFHVLCVLEHSELNCTQLLAFRVYLTNAS